MLKDKPVRIIGVYLGEGRRKATVYKDLVTKQYITQRETEGFSGVFSQTFDSLDKAEDFAEDWVL